MYDDHKRVHGQSCQAIFSVPGGKVETGETLEQAVVREVLQETGLNLPVICEDEGHKTLQQWEVFRATLTNERPTVVPQSEYSGGEAVWIHPKDIVTISPPGRSCVCSVCDAMTLNTKLFYFKRPNSDRWIYRTINGTYHQKQFESVMLNIQQFNDTWVDKWSLHDLRVCPTAWVNVNEWENHQAHGALTLGYTPPNEWSDVTKNHPAL
jgi:8-oxo-dGTP pyrophosphatase MutT (NUDIX family)